jgi:hypothetical protein
MKSILDLGANFNALKTNGTEKAIGQSTQPVRLERDNKNPEL